MNKSASFTKYLALLIVVVMALAVTSCEYLPFLEHQHNFVDGVCKCGETEECLHETVVDGKCIDCDEYIYSTVADILALKDKLADGKTSTRRYAIKVTVKELTNAVSGGMIVEDDKDSITVESLFGIDGTAYSALSVRPDNCDKLTLLVLPENRGGQILVKSATIIDHEAIDEIVEVPVATKMTIAEAREADKDTLVQIKGVVARIAYSYGPTPAGFIIVDGTSSIYVHGADLAASVKIGNTVELTGSKTWWVLEDEQNNANKFGYKGSCQLEYPTLISNDNGNTAFDKSWIEETTVKAIMDTPASEDITNKIFKVTALVKKAVGTGFTNYYIDDIDGVTGTYVYTQCSGGDFAWLDEFDGKICTVYVVAQNAKSTSSGCSWRFLPVEVLDEGYVFNTDDAAEYAVNYHGLPQFLASYSGDPALELVTSVSSELLGFEGATLSYSSSNQESVYFTTTEDGKVVFHGAKPGEATVTVKGEYNGKSFTKEITIVIEKAPEVDSITIAEAVSKEVGEEVYIRGIVGPSAVNQPAFYLFDETGMVAVRLSNGADFATFAIGNEVVIKGTRDMWHKEGASYGQIVISNATVAANYYGTQDYLTIDPISDKTPEYFYNLDEQDMSETTKLYNLTVTIDVEETTYYTNIYIKSGETTIRLYCSSANQYNWLKQFAGETVTVEIAPCNWNSKSYYTGCVLAVVLEDGTKVMNTFNWN